MGAEAALSREASPSSPVCPRLRAQYGTLPGLPSVGRGAAQFPGLTRAGPQPRFPLSSKL